MQTFALSILAVCAVLLLGVLTKTNQHLKGLRKIMSNINETLIELNGKLTEASTEILSLVGQLQDEKLTPEGRAALEEIKGKVNALADIVPNEPPQG